MKSSLDCFPCFSRQALDAARLVSDDPGMHEKIIRQVCRLAAEMDMNQSPVVMGQAIHRLVRRIADCDDPYASIKSRYNQFALSLYPQVEERVKAAADPFDAAVRIAITGNSIDFGAYSSTGFSETHLRQLIDTMMHEPVTGEIDQFKQAVAHAHDILYLADNTGEIVFDRLLIEQLPCDRLTVAVRGKPVINDATTADAELAGITALCPVIDNGSDAPGTLMHECSDAFIDKFNNADLVIAKGQGNYESLSDIENKMIYFLLKAKCPVIAEHLNCPTGSMIVMPVNKAIYADGLLYERH